MATQYTAGLTTGQVLTAATMNTIGAAWESYTPTLKQGANTLTATIIYAKYARIQKTVFLQVALQVTQAGPGNQVVTVTYPSGLEPVTQDLGRVLGTFQIFDSGVAFYTGSAVVSSSTIRGAGYGGADFMGATAPAVTLAVNDKISFTAIYEVA